MLYAVHPAGQSLKMRATTSALRGMRVPLRPPLRTQPKAIRPWIVPSWAVARWRRATRRAVSSGDLGAGGARERGSVGQEGGAASLAGAAEQGVVEGAGGVGGLGGVLGHVGGHGLVGEFGVGAEGRDLAHIELFAPAELASLDRIRLDRDADLRCGGADGLSEHGDGGVRRRGMAVAVRAVESDDGVEVDDRAAGTRRPWRRRPARPRGRLPGSCSPTSKPASTGRQPSKYWSMRRR